MYDSVNEPHINHLTTEVTDSPECHRERHGRRLCCQSPSTEAEGSNDEKHCEVSSLRLFFGPSSCSGERVLLGSSSSRRRGNKGFRGCRMKQAGNNGRKQFSRSVLLDLAWLWSIFRLVTSGKFPTLLLPILFLFLFFFENS